jgi:ribosome-associated protein
METNEMKEVVINALQDLKADNINVLDVKARTSVTDLMVIASGTSSRHVKSLADNVVSEVKGRGGKPLGVEGAESNDWILVDLGEIVVHVMMPATRSFYDLERFWQDSDEIDQLASEIQQ